MKWFPAIVCCLAAGAAASAAPNPSCDCTPLELAKRLTNPFADVINIPVNQNPDFGLGSDDDWRYTLTVQPVIPIHLNPSWNIISRTVVPVIYDDNGGDFGIGDIAQSFFLSPTMATEEGWVWGAGPIFLLPTSTVDHFGLDRVGLGPTVGLLWRGGPWTIGALTNHTWSLGADEARDHVSATFLQPFIDYTTDTSITFSVNTETTYNWTQDQWTVPVNLVVRKLFDFDGMKMSVALGPRFYLEGPSGAPEWGVRLGVTLIFPK